MAASQFAWRVLEASYHALGGKLEEHNPSAHHALHHEQHHHLHRVVVDHPEPLAALQRGEISCVVVRNVLTSSQRENVLRRLRAFTGRANAIPGAGFQSPSRTDVGATVHRFVNDPAKWREVAPRINQMFVEMFAGSSHNDTADDVDGIKVFHHVLNSLARRSGKTVVVPANIAPNLPGPAAPATPAIFRSLVGPNSNFPPHLDGFHRTHLRPRY